MIRRSVIPLNNITKAKKNKINLLISNYVKFEQKVINTLWNHKINYSRFVDKKYFQKIKTPLTERYKQCASKQALAVVKSQNKKENKRKPVIKNKSLELDNRFIKIENGKNSFDLWIKLSILGERPIYLPAKKHYHLNNYLNSDWNLKDSCRLRRNRKGLFLDLFFEKEQELKEKGEIVGLDIGYRKLAVLSDGQIIGKDLRELIKKFYNRKKSHLIVKEYINKELKKINFSNINVLVVEDLKNVKKNKKHRFTRHINRLLSNWAYRQALFKLEMLCEENRVYNPQVNPFGTSQVCNQCKVRDKTNRKDERYECHHCGWRADADYNSALNIRDFWLVQGEYGILSENRSCIPMVNRDILL